MDCGVVHHRMVVGPLCELRKVFRLFGQFLNSVYMFTLLKDPKHMHMFHFNPLCMQCLC